MNYNYDSNLKNEESQTGYVLYKGRGINNKAAYRSIESTSKEYLFCKILNLLSNYRIQISRNYQL